MDPTENWATASPVPARRRAAARAGSASCTAAISGTAALQTPRARTNKKQRRSVTRVTVTSSSRRRNVLRSRRKLTLARVMNMKRLFLVGVSAGLVLSLAAAAQQATPQGPQVTNDWPNVGNDPGGMKFSPLTQITPTNVTQLTKAWTYDLGVPASGYTVTPIVVNNVMYLPVQGAIITALSTDSGKELWKQDLRKFEALGGNPSAGGRGISYWPGTPQTGPRIVIATTNGFLVQLNAKTGALVPGR